MKLFWMVCIAMVWSVGIASAQTILKVPYGSAHFAWDVPSPGEGQSPADKHTVVCGTVSVDVPMPATSIPVKDVVSTVGVYGCSLYASNAFGRQVAPNIPFPEFEAGLEPAAPLNPRLEVHP